MNRKAILERLDIAPLNSGAGNGQWLLCPEGAILESRSPATGELLAKIRQAGREEYEAVVERARHVWAEWREYPAPKRGLVIREIADELRRHQDDLGALVSMEMGKILAEGKGEVQEMIDIADFAVGLSRQLYGLSMHSERPGHRMYEQWHPLGVVGVITSFNFPVAVWAWNAMIAAVCGDCVIWKPSLTTPLCAIAVQHICDKVLARHGWQGVFSVVAGPVTDVGEPMLRDRRLPLISATGSCRMGRHVAQVVGERLGRTLLELGGNNAVIVMADADLKLAVRAILFGAVGTAGQRCTSVRRVFVQKRIAAKLEKALVAAYKQVRVGDPLEERTLMGPLINEDAVETMFAGLARIQAEGGELIHGGNRRPDLGPCFMNPAIVRSHPDMAVLHEEIFAPIVHLIEFDDLEHAITWNNFVPQGLSSAIFTKSLEASETFLSARGSDCGIANVNIGTSGAEIGGAFGGEKDTGGGREAGSDAWKNYMRRQTVTVNWSGELPLAQGIEFV